MASVAPPIHPPSPSPSPPSPPYFPSPSDGGFWVVILLLLFMIGFLIYMIKRKGNANYREYDIESGPPTRSRSVRRPPCEIFVGVPFEYESDKRTGISTDECVICLEQFNEGDNCRDILECGHIFHQKCIDEWLARASSCPICRHSFCKDFKVKGDQNLGSNIYATGLNGLQV